MAIFDLLEENRFALPDARRPSCAAGPVPAAPRDPRPAAGLRASAPPAEQSVGEFHLSLTPFNQVVQGHFRICESYFDAVKRLPASQIEVIDMGRRGIHNEGSRILLERLDGQGRDRHGDRPAALHPDLRAALQGLTRLDLPPALGALLLRLQRGALADGRGHHEEILRDAASTCSRPA